MYFFDSWFKNFYQYEKIFLDIILSNKGNHKWVETRINSKISVRSLWHSYKTKPKESCHIESHRRTIDLQYCHEGGEKIGIDLDEGNNFLSTSYNEEIDKEIWLGDKLKLVRFTLSKGTFVLVKPNQLHMPQLFDNKNSFIVKTVIKIPIKILTYHSNQC